ncbi:tail length tape measure protein [Mycobacterium phage SWU2]|uniref:Tail length tape-measure protein n=1 Tax=Mycobacterium phage SWU2 TaxID=2077150 RepID=A0A2K9VIB7_9CAUD|nr:tail length tape measure protein [Mycobacterium phage SWU2]AUV61985.1 tail length tape-measure protein [Mycobacterium phage SWU2]
MAGAGGEEVGRISIRVVPDTDRFREDLERELRAAEKGHRVQIPVEADASEFRREVEAAVKNLPDAEIDVEANTKGVRAEILAAARNATAKIDVDTNGIRRKLDLLNIAFEKRVASALDNKPLIADSFQSMQRRLNTLDLNWDRKVKDTLAKIKPQIDLQVSPEFDYRLRQRLKKFEKSNMLDLKIDPKFDFQLRQRLAKLQNTKFEPDGFQSSMLSELDKVTRRIEVKIPLTAEGERFRTQIRAQIEALEKSIRAKVPVDLELAAGQKAKIAAEIAALKSLANFGDEDDSGISQFTKGLTKAGNEVEHVGKKFLGLTRIGWIVVAVFAAAAPLIGLVAGLLAGLPSLITAFGVGAGVVALGVEGIKTAAQAALPAFEAVKTAVSGVFEARLTPMFKTLGDTLTALTPGLEGVAQGLSDVFKGFTDVVSTGPGFAAIQNILANTQTFFSQLAPIIGTATQSFLTLSSAGSDAFGYLTGSLGRFATGFDEMVNRVTQNGVFDGAMRGLSQTLDGVTGLFTRLMESGLQAMSELGGPLNTLFTGMGDALVALMPGLTSFSALIGNVGGTLLSALAPAIQAVTPAFISLSNTLGALLVGNIQSLSPLLTQIAGALGTTLTTALQAVQPLLPQLLTTFEQFATTLTTSLAPILPQLATQFGVLLGQVIQLAPSFLNLLTTAIIPLIPKALELAQSLLPLTMSAIQLAPVVLKLVNGFLQFLAACAPVVGVISSLASPLLNLVTGFDSVRNGVQTFINILSSLPGVISGVMGSVVGAVVSGVSQVISQFVQAGGQILSEVGSWVGRIMGVLANLGSQMASAAASAASAFIGALASGISAGVSRVAGAVSSVIGAVRAMIPNSPAKEGPLAGAGWRAVTGFGDTLGDALASGMPGAKDKIVLLATQLMQAIKDVFGSAEGLTLNFNLGGGSAGMGGLAGMAEGLNPQLSAMNTNLGEMRDLTTGLDESMTGLGQTMTGNLKQQMDLIQLKKDELEVQRQMLQNQKNATEDKAQKQALQAQIDEINLMKDKLELQRQQMDYQSEYGVQVEDSSKKVDEYVRGMYDAAKGAVTSQQQQLFSDLGISGQGAIPQLIEQGVAMGENFIFNVSSADEAIAIKNNQTNKKALQYKPRS